MRLADLPDPIPGAGEVRVRVRAASVNALDWRLARGDPFLVRLGYGLLRPKHRVPGADAAGVVERVGEGVTEFAAGDEVYADLSNSRMGAFAELVTAPAPIWAKKPRNLTFEEAAAVPVAGITALQGLRDVARVKSGERVLVNGASGGVGTFAVQIARALGATVTGVCSSRNVKLVSALGATSVIDYTREDPTQASARFDVVFDCAAHRSIRDYRRVLAPGGRYVMVGGDFGPMMQAMALGPLLSRGGRTFATFVAKSRREDLDALTHLIETGKLKPAIDRRYALAETAAAVSHVDEGHTQGKTIITI